MGGECDLLIVAWPADIMWAAAFSALAEAANAISSLRTMLDGCWSLSAGRRLRAEQQARPKAQEAVELLQESADWPCARSNHGNAGC